MKKIAFVSCSKQKRQGRHLAKDLYDSRLFELAYRCATESCHQVYILSAKHGLLHPEQVIENYDETLSRMNASDRKAWAKKVLDDIKKKTRPDDELYFFAGVRYREYLLESLAERNLCRVPLEGLPIGKQLQRLKQNNTPR